MSQRLFMQPASVSGEVSLDGISYLRLQEYKIYIYLDVFDARMYQLEGGTRLQVPLFAPLAQKLQAGCPLQRLI